MTDPTEQDLVDAVLYFDTAKEVYAYLNITKYKFYQLKRKYKVPDVFTVYNDDEIRSHIMEFNHEHPTGGEKLLLSYLKSKNIRIRRDRLRYCVR